MNKKRRKSVAKVAACREHSCPKPRRANGFCDEHQNKAHRNHDRKPPPQSKEE